MRETPIPAMRSRLIPIACMLCLALAACGQQADLAPPPGASLPPAPPNLTMSAMDPTSVAEYLLVASTVTSIFAGASGIGGVSPARGST